MGRAREKWTIPEAGLTQPCLSREGYGKVNDSELARGKLVGETCGAVMFYPCLLVPCHLATFIPRVQGVTQIWFLR